MKNLLIILFVGVSAKLGFGQSDIDTVKYKVYDNGDYRIMQIQTTDTEMNPIDYTFTYYYTSDGTFLCNLPKCARKLSPGVLKVEQLKNHTKDGLEKEFFRCDEIEYPYYCDEAFRIKRMGKWKMGMKNGKWKTYHKNGKLSSLVRYKNGKRTGKFISYHTDGRILSTAKYKNGECVEDMQYLPSAITIK